MMKIIMGLLVITVMTQAVHAQTDKGDWMVGGSMTINTTTDNSEFALMPSAGYFFARGLVAGANVSLDFGKTGSQKTNSVLVGPFARYYFTLGDSRFKPLLHAEYNIGNIETRLPNSKTSNTLGNLFLGAGGAFFINNNVALEAVAGYNRSKVQGQDAQNGFRFRIGFQVHLLGHEVRRS